MLPCLRPSKSTASICGTYRYNVRGTTQIYERTWNVTQNQEDGKSEGGIVPAMIVTRIISELTACAEAGTS